MDEVKSVVGELPFIPVERAEAMTQLIQDNDVCEALELAAVTACRPASSRRRLSPGRCERLMTSVREETLALGRQQADDVRARPEDHVRIGLWRDPPWPDSALPVVDATRERKLHELRRFVDKVKRDRAWLDAKLRDGN